MFVSEKWRSRSLCVSRIYTAKQWIDVYHAHFTGERKLYVKTGHIYKVTATMLLIKPGPRRKIVNNVNSCFSFEERNILILRSFYEVDSQGGPASVLYVFFTTSWRFWRSSVLLKRRWLNKITRTRRVRTLTSISEPSDRPVTVIQEHKIPPLHV